MQIIKPKYIMKKTFFLIVFTIFYCSLTAQTQYIEITPTGMMSVENNEKSYIVLTIEGKSAAQLYKNAMRYINKVYKNPNSVIKSKTENESLSFAGYIEKLFTCKWNPMSQFKVDMEFRFDLEFKDGRIKLELGNLEFTSRLKNSPFYLNSAGANCAYIFNKKGEVRGKKEKKAVEEYLNKQISELAEALKYDQAAEEDW